ncbi:RDD family protein [Candidatus Poriferisodalis sp.]|uniref:RDD family protein n=1 Tax=Candidatus Poriferisodalis sp. TaxID=3101277 RepID=UPI003B01185B
MGCLAYAHVVTGDEYESYGWLLVPLVIMFVALSLTATYETWATAATGQTRGKGLKGIQVVRLRDGRKPGVGASFVRAALPVSPRRTALSRGVVGFGVEPRCWLPV